MAVAATDDRGLVAPREVDPAFRTPPDEVALHDRLWLFVDHRRSHFCDGRPDELEDRLQRVAGVGNIVDDQYFLIGQVNQIELGRQHHRELERFPDAGVVLHADYENVLDRKGIPERPGGEQPSTGNGQDDVGHPSGVGDQLRKFPAARTKELPGEDFAFCCRRR